MTKRQFNNPLEGFLVFGLTIKNWTKEQKALWGRIASQLEKQYGGIKAGDVLIMEGLADNVVGVDYAANSVFCAAGRPTYDDDGSCRGGTTDYTTLYAVSIHDVIPVKGKAGWWRMKR